MHYFRVELECPRRGEWFAFIRETCETKTATSRRELEAAVRNHIESALGEHHFEVIWVG